MSPCPHPLGHTDAARRTADNVNMHFPAIGWDAVGKYVALRLQDGDSDHCLYDTYRDAVRHVPNEKRYFFVRLLPMQISLCEAQVLIDFKRKANDAGFTVADPDDRHGGREIIVQGRPREHVIRQLDRLGRRT